MYTRKHKNFLKLHPGTNFLKALFIVTLKNLFVFAQKAKLNSYF